MGQCPTELCTSSVDDISCSAFIHQGCNPAVEGQQICQAQFAFNEQRSQLLLCSDGSMNTIYFCSLLIWGHKTFAKSASFWCWYWHYSFPIVPPFNLITSKLWLLLDVYLLSGDYFSTKVYLLDDYIKLIEKLCFLIANTIGKIYWKLLFTFFIIFCHRHMIQQFKCAVAFQ